MKILAVIAGVIFSFAGGLWMFQGFGIAQTSPMLCTALRGPLYAPSPTWAAFGFFVLMTGVAGVLWGLRRSS